jgi:hypothetical protein
VLRSSANNRGLIAGRGTTEPPAGDAIAVDRQVGMTRRYALAAATAISLSIGSRAFAEQASGMIIGINFRDGTVMLEGGLTFIVSRLPSRKTVRFEADVTIEFVRDENGRLIATAITPDFIT